MASCIIELKKGDIVSVEKIQAATPHNENANYFEGHLIQETHHYDLWYQKYNILNLRNIILDILI